MDNHEAIITADDITVTTVNKPGLVACTEGDMTIALETTITEDLLYEGLAREFVNRVQNMRKDAGFEVTDRIQIYTQASPNMSKAIDNQSQYIKMETLCEDIKLGKLDGSFKKDWKIGDEILTIGIKKL